MKPEELRVGNLVYLHDYPIPFIYVCDHETIKNADNYTPIPLTEEWLVKFGFHRIDIETINARYEFYKRCNSKPLTILGNGKFPKGYFVEYYGVEVDYVHQLQNLYYALTDEELHINSPN